MIKRGSYFILLTIALFILAACSGDDGAGEAEEVSADGESSGEEYTIQAAHVVSADTTQHEAFEKFKELVEEKSDGRIQVDIYPDGQLGGEREMIESTQTGSIQMASPSVGVLANFSSALEVFDFPFIFEDIPTAHEVLDGEFGQDLLKGLEENGLVGLNYGELGYRHLSNNSHEVVEPSDIAGMKIRTMEVPMHIAYWEHIGANPTPLAFTEVFTGLSQGVVDGVENVLGLIYTGKFHEVSNYITTTGHIYDPEIYIMNQDFYNSLSEEDQEIIQSSIDESVEFLRDRNAEYEEELRTLLEEEGAIFRDLTDEEYNVWLEAAVPFYEEYADEIDKEKLIQLLEAVGNDKFLEAIQ
jgi:tripartite ATP-independent transporter DctP family solute receptor